MNLWNFWTRKEANHRTQQVAFEQILQKAITAIKNFVEPSRARTTIS